MKAKFKIFILFLVSMLCFCFFYGCTNENNNENSNENNLLWTDGNIVYDFAFANQTQITSITIPNTVTSIGERAFEYCANLTSLSLPDSITSIGRGAFANCSSLTNITIPAGVKHIGEGAFAGCSNLNISVNTNNPNYSAQGNILYNKARTKIIGSGDIATNITIPTTVTEVGASALEGNTNLQRLDIYGTPVIDDFAFYDCANLNEVYCYSYTVPEMGISPFSGNTFTLYVPYSKYNAYNKSFGYPRGISSIPIVVTFVIDEEVYQTINTYYGANIVRTDAFKEGYTFNYWVDNNGNTYQNGGVWDSTEDLTVYANWEARQFYINFYGYGTENLEDKLITYDNPIGELPIPILTGYDFLGWREVNGGIYTADTIFHGTGNLTLIADFDGVIESLDALCFVILGKESGKGGSDYVRAEYLSAMPMATAPTRKGYIFQGYYTGQNGSGEKYYNADMSSVKDWNIESHTKLYAYWIGKSYSVTFDTQGGIGGSNSVIATMGKSMPVATAPTKEGYTFIGYYTQVDGNGAKYYNFDMSSTDEWDIDRDTTLYAYWKRND